uniref:Polycomb group protein FERTILIZATION-INDEPENDENT ENDOSPERM n=3 Tax=Noccaea caerulescens TaxID=107243 RepID=A0A1J3FR89_NOCCA
MLPKKITWAGTYRELGLFKKPKTLIKNWERPKVERYILYARVRLPVKVVALSFGPQSMRNRLALAGSNLVGCWDPSVNTVDAGDALIPEGVCYVGAADDSFFAVGWAISDLQSFIICGGSRGRLIVLNAARLSYTRTLVGHEDDINDIKTHPQRLSLILTSSKDCTIKLWCVVSGLCILTLSDQYKKDIFWAICQPDYGCYWVVASGEQKHMEFWYMGVLAGMKPNLWKYDKDFESGYESRRNSINIGRGESVYTFSNPAYADSSQYFDRFHILSLERDVGMTLWVCLDNADAKHVLGFSDIPHYGRSKSVVSGGSDIISIGNKQGETYVLKFKNVLSPKYVDILSGKDSNSAVTQTACSYNGGLIASIYEDTDLVNIWVSKTEVRTEKKVYRIRPKVAACQRSKTKTKKKQKTPNRDIAVHRIDLANDDDNDDEVEGVKNVVQKLEGLEVTQNQ